MSTLKKISIAFITFLACINIASNTFAQSGETVKNIPLNPDVRTGKLPNGFTYFIQKNTEPKNRVTLYLVNKVGSILENYNQQGLAHFMEHMNFNGTTHYPKNELVDYLQKAGVRFGADLNAFTSFDETIYQLPIPTDDTSVLNHGFEIMRDWAKGALLDSNEINGERGVVLEEERLGKGAGDRMLRQYLPLILNGSRYAQRLPIGKDTILKNFAPATLRDFYNTWYRPDLQALVAVGDIDVDATEKLIKQKFSDLKNPGQEKERIKYKMELTGKNQYIAVTDKEMSYTDIQFITKQKGLTIKTEADYRTNLERFLFNRMISDRLAEIKKQPVIPYQDGAIALNSFFAGIDAFILEVIPKNGETENGFKTVYREMERATRFGFTPTELQRAKSIYLESMKRAAKEKDKQYSDALANEYAAYFLTGTAAPGIDAEYTLTKKLLPEISLADVNNLTKTLLKNTDRDILILAPDKEKNNLPKEADFMQWITEVQHEKLAPYIDDSIATTLISTMPAPGKIIASKNISSIGVTEWQLGNGIKVLVKSTDFSNDDIAFNGFAKGGSDDYNDSDYISAANAAVIISAGGVGDFNSTQLNKYLSGKQAGVGVQLSANFHEVYGFTNHENLETSLQLAYLYFTKPRKDTARFQSIIAHLKEEVLNKNNSPEQAFSDTINSILYNNDYRYTPLDNSKIASISLNKAMEVYKNLYGNTSNLAFVFVGNIDTTTLKPLIEKYIASLPSSNNTMQTTIRPAAPIDGKIIKTVYKGSEDKASVKLYFTGNYSYAEEDNKAMDALAEILTIRLTEVLREKESGVYSPNASFYADKLRHRFTLTINFGCAPKNADKLIAAALNEVNNLKLNGADNIDIEKYKAEDKRQHELSMRSNGFWLYYMLGQLQNNESIEAITDYDKVLNSVTAAQIKKLASMYLIDGNYAQMVLLPEKN